MWVMFDVVFVCGFLGFLVPIGWFSGAFCLCGLCIMLFRWFWFGGCV